MIELHPPIQIVDENDIPLRGGTMDEVQLNGLWHRIVRVMVYDKSTCKYLLQMVAPNPYYDGGLWDTASSGHVDEGESYEEAAIRETAEEVGVCGLTLVEIERYRTEVAKNGRTYRRHNVIFLAETDETPIVSPNDEVEKVVWMSGDELRDLTPKIATTGLLRFVKSL